MSFYAFVLAQDIIVDRNKGAQEEAPYDSERYSSSKCCLLSIVEILKI